MPVTAHSDSNDDSPPALGATHQTGKPPPTLRGRITGGLIVGGLLAGLGIGGWLVWHNYIAHPTLAERRLLAQLRHEPALQGLPGWKRTSYVEYSGTFGEGRTKIEAIWESRNAYSVVRRQVLSKFVANYGAVTRRTPGFDSFTWDSNKRSRRVELDLLHDSPGATITVKVLD